MAHRKLAIFRRRISTVLSVLSLLLCVATLALWVRSYLVYDLLQCTRRSAVHSVAGKLVLILHEWPSAELGWFAHSASSPFGDTVRAINGSYAFVVRWSRAGFEFGDTQNGLLAYSVPHWSLALLFAILPALYIHTLIRSRRLRRAGHCPRCGYDLRATPERCPECGSMQM